MKVEGTPVVAGMNPTTATTQPVEGKLEARSVKSVLNGNLGLIVRGAAVALLAAIPAVYLLSRQEDPNGFCPANDLDYNSLNGFTANTSGFRFTCIPVEFNTTKVFPTPVQAPQTAFQPVCFGNETIVPPAPQPVPAPQPAPAPVKVNTNQNSAEQAIDFAVEHPALTTVTAAGLVGLVLVNRK